MKTFKLLRWLVILSLLLPALLANASEPIQRAAQKETPFPTGPGADENWLHFGYDSTYTAHNRIESTIGVANVAQLKRRWGIGCDDGEFAVIGRAPAIYNGTLYTTHAVPTYEDYCDLLAYDANSGQVLWQFGGDCLLDDMFAGQPVVSEDGIVFYLRHEGPTFLYALDADSGDQLWEAPFGFDILDVDNALVTVDETNGVIYLVENHPYHTDSGRLFALDKQTGQVVWYKGPLTDEVLFKGDYALLKQNKIFALGEIEVQYWEQDHMLRIDATSQDIEITFDRPAVDYSYDIEHYTFCSNTLVAVFDDYYEPVKFVVAYDPSSPTIAWQQPFSTTITGEIACNAARNLLYVPTNPYLYALDATTGEEIWRYAGYHAIYNPSIANGVIYFLSGTNMYALDEDTRTQLLSYPLGYEAEPSSQVAIADGMLFFSGNGGTCDLYALGQPQPPNVPANPVPANGAGDIPTDQVLHWQGGDPDGDPVTYTVSLGSVDPPPIVGVSAVMTSYNPGLLDANTTYYWNIVASDGLSEAAGPMWSFTTTLATQVYHYVYLPAVVRDR